MKRIATVLMVLIAILTICNFSFAALIDNHDGTITDTDKGLMWMQNANYSATWRPIWYNITFEGKMDWDTAMVWVDELQFAGYDDWRLPKSDSCLGYHCNGEMGHLYYAELGNKGVYDPDFGQANYGPFINFQSNYYWSDTSFEPYPDGKYANDFTYGNQSAVFHQYQTFVLPVRETGPIAPEPVSSILFITGGTVLWFRKKIFKK